MPSIDKTFLSQLVCKYEEIYRKRIDCGLNGLGIFDDNASCNTFIC